MAKKGNRSPLKGPPLRYPGQSVDERRAEIIDKLQMPVFIAAALLAVALMEVYATLTGKRSPLWAYVIGAVAAGAFAAMRIYLAIPTLRALRQARDGERVVGQFLDILREQGYRVFHDVVGTGFNVDHILIGPGGIYTVETKTWSKPAKGAPKVWFDGEEINVDGTHVDRDPVVQARAQAKWIKDLLSESTGRVFPVRPVILFPGWFVEPARGAYKEMWVLNPKALPEFLKNEKVLLAPEDVKLASYHLSRFIRSTPSA